MDFLRFWPELSAVLLLIGAAVQILLTVSIWRRMRSYEKRETSITLSRRDADQDASIALPDHSPRVDKMALPPPSAFPPSSDNDESWPDPAKEEAVLRWQAYAKAHPKPELAEVWRKGRQKSVMFATNRCPSYESGRDYFNGERADIVTWGSALVRVPDDHTIGSKVRVPSEYRLFGLTLREQPDPAKHFAVTSFEVMSEASWATANIDADEALIFVHGFNTGFKAGLLQTAQIAFDLQTQALPVHFSWPSRGTVDGYFYDMQSAIASKEAFLRCLRNVMNGGLIKRVHIIAHSMGNFLVLNALANLGPRGLKYPVSELMMAAPDVDWHVFQELIKAAAPATTGRTLYASSVDRALAVAKRIAGNVPKAGDVPLSGPMIVDGVDTIDVTAVGAEMFGFNHSTYAESPSVLNDIGLLISDDPRRPAPRLVQIRGVPEGATPPKYWRYQN